MVITVDPVRAGGVSSSGRIDPEIENVRLAVPTALASAPRTGLFVVIENEVVPSPLTDAVSNGVLVEISMLAEPEPEEISCPVASRIDMENEAEAVLAGEVSSTGRISASGRENANDALPTMGKPITPFAVVENVISASFREDISPDFCGIIHAEGGKWPEGFAA